LRGVEGAFIVLLLSIALLWSRHTLWIPAGAGLGVWMVSRLCRARRTHALRRHAVFVVGIPVCIAVKLFFDWQSLAIGLALYAGAVIVIDRLATRAWRNDIRRVGVASLSVPVWAGAVLFGAWLSGPAYSPSSLKSMPPGGVLVCLGDSLTSGLRLDKSGTYPGFLAEDTGLSVINAGVANDTAADALARVERDVLAHEPDVVLIMIGGNDYLYETPREVFEERLDELVSRVSAACGRVVLVEVPSGIVSDRFGGTYRRVAARYRLPLVPDSVLRARFLSGLLFDSLRPDKYRETIDGIHLTEAGQRRLASALVPYLPKQQVVR